MRDKKKTHSFSQQSRFFMVAGVVCALAIAYFFYQALGDTTLGVTLRINQQLEKDLLLHWTFDSNDIDMQNFTADIVDASGQGNHGNGLFPPEHASSSTSTAPIVIFLTSGTSWTPPSNWTDNNTVEVIGGGGAGDNAASNSAGAGGGGGGYSKKFNVSSITRGVAVTYQVGAGGTTDGASGTDTYFCNSSSNCASIAGTAVVVGAKGGGGGTSATANGTGGAAASGFGDVKYSGGDGGDGNSVDDSSGAGGGAGGPFGNGAQGGSGDDDAAATESSPGGGGGGAGGGFAGTNGATTDTPGAPGGNNYLGTGRGTGSSDPGENGGGGSGGNDAAAGAVGGNGSEWFSSAGVVAGAGGGGGGAGDGSNGGAGGTYGAGGGGGEGTEGDGANGIVVISYSSSNPTAPGPIGEAMSFRGNNDYIATSSSPGSVASVQTFAFWVKIATSTVTQKILNLQGQGTIQVNTNSSGQLIVTGLAGSAVMYIDGVATTTAAASSAVNTDWHHVVITTGSSFTANNITVGKVGNQYFGGFLDDMRMYSRVLSADEIRRLYELGATTRISTTITTNPTLETGLIGHWTFDGKNTDLSQVTAEVRDRSTTAAHGDWENHASTSVPGVIGQALDCDGTDDRVMMGDVDALDIGPAGTNFSIALWVKPRAFASGAFVSKLNSSANYGNYSFGLSGTGGQIALTLRDVSGTSQARSTAVTEVVALNQWNHIAVTFNETTNVANFYINGVDVGPASAFTVERNVDATVGFRLCHYIPTNVYTNASLDDVRVYNRELSSDEVTRLYGLGATTRVGMTINKESSLQSGLVGYWPFDGKDTNLGSNTAEVLDRSGQGNNGNWMNHASTTASGVMGQAILLDGTNDFVDFGLPASLNLTGTAVTLAAWVNTKSLAGSAIQRIISMPYIETDGSEKYALLINNSTDLVEFTLSLDTIGDSITAAYSSKYVNEWHHIAGVYENDVMRIYIDGVLVAGPTNHVYSTPNITSATGNFLIGRYGPTFGQYFNGAIDDARVYNRALSQAEITQLYQMGK